MGLFVILPEIELCSAPRILDKSESELSLFRSEVQRWQNAEPLQQNSKLG